MSEGGRTFAITYAEGSRTGGLQRDQVQRLIRDWHAIGWTPIRRRERQRTWATWSADGGASLMNPEVPPEIQIA